MAHIWVMDSSITIIGGGLNGPTLALALAQSGFIVTLVDARPRNDFDGAFDGRAYALAHASTQMLGALSLWHDLKNKCQPMLDIKASDGRAGSGASSYFLHFDHSELEEGPMGYLCEDRILRPALLDAIIAHPKITVRFEAKVIDQDKNGNVTLETGEIIPSDLIVGCDGRTSGTAERASISRSFKDYGQTALVCAVEHQHPHKGIAHQYFMPAGPLAILPLPGNRSSIVWAEKTSYAKELMQSSDDTFLEALKPRFGDFLGDVQLTGRRYAYPLTLTLAEAYIAPRIALVGDAAHGVHPIAGQGLNLGFRDIAALTQVLVEAKRRGEDIGSLLVLERYQTWRRFDATTLALGMDTVNRIFSNDLPLIKGIRRFGMGLIQQTNTVRRGFMRQAAGLDPNRPKLLKGQMP